MIIFVWRFDTEDVFIHSFYCFSNSFTNIKLITKFISNKVNHILYISQVFFFCLCGKFLCKCVLCVGVGNTCTYTKSVIYTNGISAFFFYNLYQIVNWASNFMGGLHILLNL